MPSSYQQIDDASPFVGHGGMTASEEKTMGMLCHLMAFCGLLLPIPLANIIGPLIIWLIKKDESEFVNDQGKEAINFQITVFIALMCCIPLIFVVVGLILLPIIAVASLILVIIAAANAAGGTPFRYPMTIRFIT